MLRIICAIISCYGTCQVFLLVMAQMILNNLRTGIVRRVTDINSAAAMAERGRQTQVRKQCCVDIWRGWPFSAQSRQGFFNAASWQGASASGRGGTQVKQRTIPPPIGVGVDPLRLLGVCLAKNLRGTRKKAPYRQFSTHVHWVRGIAVPSLPQFSSVSSRSPHAHSTAVSKDGSAPLGQHKY